jgi:hypothetical protein
LGGPANANCAITGNTGRFVDAAWPPLRPRYWGTLTPLVEPCRGVMLRSMSVRGVARSWMLVAASLVLVVGCADRSTSAACSKFPEGPAQLVRLPPANEHHPPINVGGGSGIVSVELPGGRPIARLSISGSALASNGVRQSALHRFLMVRRPGSATIAGNDRFGHQYEQLVSVHC